MSVSARLSGLNVGPEHSNRLNQASTAANSCLAGGVQGPRARLVGQADALDGGVHRGGSVGDCCALSCRGVVIDASRTGASSNSLIRHTEEALDGAVR